MLVLGRKIGERILLGDDVVITVVKVAGNKVRLGIDAPDSVKILREEIAEGFNAEDFEDNGKEENAGVGT